MFVYLQGYPENNCNFLSDRNPVDLWWVWPIESVEAGEEGTTTPEPEPALVPRIVEVKTGRTWPDTVGSLVEMDSAMALAKGFWWVAVGLGFGMRMLGVALIVLSFGMLVLVLTMIVLASQHPELFFFLLGQVLGLRS